MTRVARPREGGLTALVLLAFAVLVCVRMPEILGRGRFWAEEGQNFYRSAWLLPPLQALFTSFGGYLNLVANAATLAARWLVPVADGPDVTTAVALFFQLCPPFLILTARDGWLRPPLARVSACALLLFVPGSDEVWLQTLHSQFQLTLCCAILVALDPASGRLAAFRLVLLCLAPLSGPGAIALLPLLGARALWDRTAARLRQFAALAAGAALQLLVFFHPVPTRAYHLDLATLLSVLTARHLAVPFCGLDRATVIAATIRAGLQAGHLPLWSVLLPVLVFGLFAAAALRSISPRPALWLLAAAFLVAAASYFGSLGHLADQIGARSGERYAFVPQSLLGLATLALARTTAGPTSVLAILVAVWVLAVGVFEFVQPWPMISQGPSWRREVAIWRTDPSHPLRSWPNGWTVVLPPQAASR